MQASLGRSVSITTTLAFVLAGSSVHAFESREHRLTGDSAIQVAVAYARGQGISTEPKLDAAVRFMNGEYGKLNECVDYFLYPEKMLVQVARSDVASTSAESETFDSTTTNKEIAQCEQATRLQYAQASHNNHAHFQQSLLTSRRIYHIPAMKLMDSASTFDEAYVVSRRRPKARSGCRASNCS